jgi:prepilin-type processing-associated H-X9-DG protein
MRAMLDNNARALADIQKPAQKIAVGENGTNQSGMGWNDWGGSNPGNWNNECAANGFRGHLGAANYLFIDGHVKSLRPTQTIQPFNMWGSFHTPNNSVPPVDACVNDTNINCDITDDDALGGLRTLERTYAG